MFNNFDFNQGPNQPAPSSYGVWNGPPPALPVDQRRHSYAAPGTTQRPRHAESLFFGRSNSISNQAGAGNAAIFSPNFGSVSTPLPIVRGSAGMIPLNVPNGMNMSPPTGAGPAIMNMSPGAPESAMSPGSRNIWNKMSLGSAVEDDNYGEFYLAGSLPATHQRSFSFEKQGTSPPLNHRDISPQHRNYQTPGSHLLSCEEEDEEQHVERITSKDTLGAIGSSLSHHTAMFGTSISPVSSHDSTISSATSIDSDLVSRYFCIDDIGRNAGVNNEVLRKKRSLSTSSRHVNTGLPSPPFRPFDLNDMPTNAAAFINTPSKKLYFVQFKSARMDVFFVPENSALTLSTGDYVIVDGDRGRDLGRVVRANITAEEAGLLKLKRHKEQQAILQHVPGSPSAGDKAATACTPGVCTPKQILRYAQRTEITQIASKQADEDKAVAMCLQKVEEKNLSMSVLDAEYQWDRRKLTFFYSADQRIDFRDLVRELFRIYKTRIWMCAVGSGPASEDAATVSPGSSPTPKHSAVDERQYGITTSKLFGGGPLSRYA